MYNQEFIVEMHSRIVKILKPRCSSDSFIFSTYRHNNTKLKSSVYLETNVLGPVQLIRKPVNGVNKY